MLSRAAILFALLSSSVAFAQGEVEAAASPAGEATEAPTQSVSASPRPAPAESASSPPPTTDGSARRDRSAFDASLPLVARVGLGYMDGYLTLDGRAGFAVASIDATPTIENDRWRFRSELGLRHRQTIGTPWTETTGDGTIAARFAPIRRFRVEVSGGVTARLRKAWLDQYQPIAVGQLGTTHRYSRWSRFGEIEFAGMPIRKHHARLDYRYEYTDYWADPNYDPFQRPTHLVPQDRVEHRLDASWHYLRRGVRLGAELVARHRNYYFAFARDAGSGATHATAGGAPPNPLYRVWFAEPTLDARIDAHESLRIRLAYGHEFQVDSYQGYFSFAGPHPSVEVEWQPTTRLEIDLEADLRWRRYGPNSFQQVGSHPALEDGTRRYAHRVHAGLVARYRATEHLSIFAESSLVIRASNRPDYVPGVYPASRAYDIDFDYTNFIATVGVRASR